MRIIYMGTPDFAVPSLVALHEAGHEIAYVVTQPDAVRDRGKKIKFSPVKEKAIELDIPVLQPERVRGNEEFINTLKEAAPDVIAVAAYGRSCRRKSLTSRLLDASMYMDHCFRDLEGRHLYRDLS